MRFSSTLAGWLAGWLEGWLAGWLAGFGKEFFLEVKRFQQLFVLVEVEID